MFCLLAISGRANTYNFWTTNGAYTVDAGGVHSDVALKITFITGTNKIEVRITNLQLDPTKETQALAAIDYLVAGTSGLTPSSVVMNNVPASDPNLGYVVNFTAKGSTAYTTASIATAPTTAWGIGNTTHLFSGSTQITAISGASPDYLVIGKSTNPTNYVGVNNAVTGHTPFLGTDPNEYISFTVNYAPTAGITANSVISTTQMPMVDFGTAFATGQELVLTDQPEPATVGMMLGGLGLILAAKWRRRKPQA